MNESAIKGYLMAKKGTTEETPFGPMALVYKVGGKMFALLSVGREPVRLNLKSDPILAEHLRHQYASVTPGYHMNKRHWNSVELGGDVGPEELRRMIDESYQLVTSGIPKARRKELGLD